MKFLFFNHKKELLSFGNEAICCVRILALSSAFVLTSACSESLDVLGFASGWSISTTSDPMTDTEIHTAIAWFETDPSFDAQVTIRCEGDENLIYSIATYDKNREPATIDGDFWQMRLDSQEPFRNFMSNSRFSNEINIVNQIGVSQGCVRPKNGFGDCNWEDVTRVYSKSTTDSLAAAKASQVSLRVPLTNGQVDIVIDQTEPVIRQHLNRCISAVEPPMLQRIDRQNNEESQRREAAERRRDRQRAAPPIRIGAGPTDEPVEWAPEAEEYAVE